MSIPSYFDEPRLVRLGKFLDEVKNGELYVPRFQRPFIWTDEQRLALLQSIYLGYPIGSIMVWRTQKWKLKTYERLGPVTLPLQESNLRVVQQYLLDGHQRVTTLFASLGPGLYEKHALSESWVDEEDGRMWPIYFDLLDDDPTSNPFRFRRRTGESVPDTWLGLNILLDSFALGEFKDKLRDNKQPRPLINRVQAIADVIRDYTIPVVPMATDDLEQVTTSFKRVNSGGSKMSEVHMVNALTWRESFDLLERLAELSRSLESEGWGAFDQQMIMNVCKARFEIDIYKASAEELAQALGDFPEALDQVRDAIVTAARVLRELVGVLGPAALPHSYQAVLLADALQSVPPPNDTIKDELYKWFWLTTLTEYFQSMTGSLFRRAQLHLRKLVVGDAGARPPDLPEVIDPLLRFDYRGARSRAIALLLAELNPLSPELRTSCDGHTLLAEHGNDVLVRLVASKDLPHAQRKLAAGPENRFLLPPREGAKLRSVLLDPDDDGVAALAQSHAIPLQAVSDLRSGDEAAFLHQRREKIWSLEQARAQKIGLEYRWPEADPLP